MASLVSASYASDDEEPTTVLARRAECAPAVLGVAERSVEVRRLQSLTSDESGTVLMTRNLPASTVLARAAGPEHPQKPGSLEQRGPSCSRHAAGSVEPTVVEDWSFDAEYHGFMREEVPRRRKRPRAKFDVGDQDVHGIWAPEEATEEVELSDERKLEIAEAVTNDKMRNKRGYNQDEDFDRRDERKISHLLPPRHDRDTQAVEATTEFHGERQYDYRGRSWIEVPSGLRPDEHDAFLPKKCAHTFTGHSKGVQTLRLFPTTGHLLLSASLDGTCKIWDVYNRRAMRTYRGHTEAVRDVNFTPNGRTFASTGFDRFVRVWDAESGSCLHTLTPKRKMSFCVDFYPRDDNILLAGASDNRIYQWDLRTGDIVQEYNHHLQPVNSVTFVDDDTRFVSTADDKKIFVWEFNIPVPSKYISEPHMNAVPVVELHPSGDFWCGQSMNNQIVTYQARDKVKQLRKKSFRGHLCSGYAVGLTFSPDGKYLASGDAEGRVVFWDFKTTRLYRKMHCHDAGPCIGVAWHPIEPSWLLTCGWDGLIKLWE